MCAWSPGRPLDSTRWYCFVPHALIPNAFAHSFRSLVPLTCSAHLFRFAPPARTPHKPADTIWYSYPHEYIDARCGLPPLPPTTAAGTFPLEDSGGSHSNRSKTTMERAATTPAPAGLVPVRICAEGGGGGDDDDNDAVAATLSCTEKDHVIIAIEFASYGTPTGTCGGYEEGPIGPLPTFGRAPLSMPVVKGLCMHRRTCTVMPGREAFAGFTGPRLVIQALCGPSSSSPSTTSSCNNGACWRPARELRPFTAQLLPKPIAPVAQQYYKLADIDGGAGVTKIAPGDFTFQTQREIQGGLQIKMTRKRRTRSRVGERARGTPSGTPCGTHGTTGGTIETPLMMQVRLSETTATDESAGGALVPRVPNYAGTNYTDVFTFSSPLSRSVEKDDMKGGEAEEVEEVEEVAEHHEYAEWRFGRLTFSDPSVEAGDFEINVWVVNFPVAAAQEEGGGGSLPYIGGSAHTALSTSSVTLDRVWDLVRFVGTARTITHTHREVPQCWPLARLLTRLTSPESPHLPYRVC